MRTTLQLLLALFSMSLLGSAASAQQNVGYPAYTVVSTSTQYDSQGTVVFKDQHIRYVSASGDWRSVSHDDDSEVATIYRRGRGVYQSNSRTARAIKLSEHAPGCPRRTADQLRRDPKFARTEVILGLTAYVLIDSSHDAFVSENYFVPELGGYAVFKSTTKLKDGRKFVLEPTSVIMGEPAAADLTGPDYQVIEQVPTWNAKLAEQIIFKPGPIYPPEAVAGGVSGRIAVQVIVDEAGRVISASSRQPPQNLARAAVEAAYQAWFRPSSVDGRVGISKGAIIYQFVTPK